MLAVGSMGSLSRTGTTYWPASFTCRGIRMPSWKRTISSLPKSTCACSFFKPGRESSSGAFPTITAARTRPCLPARKSPQPGWTPPSGRCRTGSCSAREPHSQVQSLPGATGSGIEPRSRRRSHSGRSQNLAQHILVTRSSTGSRCCWPHVPGPGLASKSSRDSEGHSR